MQRSFNIAGPCDPRKHHMLPATARCPGIMDLIQMAFSQRVFNAGGRIDREPALGRGRLDLCLHYQG